MFGRLASVLSSAVDVLAPPIPLQEEFVYHWNAVTKFFIDKKSDGKAPIEDTRIPFHLAEMLSILFQEEEEQGGTETGPCMEYVIHNKLMDTMYTLALADCPPGMKQHILLFFTKLLSRSKQPLLAQINIHRPAHKLVKMCGEILASPFEKEEMHLLCTVCAKIREDPHLLHCFVEYSGQLGKKEDLSKPNVDSSNNSGKFPTDQIVEFSLAKSLLSLIQSADTWISVKACEGFLLLCTSLPDTKAADILVNHTSFCNYLINRLSSLYRALPLENLEPSCIDEIKVRWGLSDTEDLNEFKGKRELSCYLSWLDYINTLIHDGHPQVQLALASSLAQNFLADVIKPKLFAESDGEVLITVSLISRSYRQITANVLLQEFTFFLIGHQINAYFDEQSLHPIQNRLVQLGNNSVSSEVSMITLKLFEEMILKFDEKILFNLVLNTLVDRGYYDSSAVDGNFSFAGGANSLLEDDPFYLSEDFEVSPGSSPASRTMAPGNIHKIMNCFLQIVPDEIKSCNTEEEIGFDSYVRDVHNQYEACVLRCLDFDWPSEALGRDEIPGGSEGSDDASSDSQPEADKQRRCFYEGSLLALLFDKLEDILNQPYEISLEVTSMISKLAMLPHPYLHEYLLNPFIPLSQGSRSLSSVLIKVVSELQVKVEEIDEYKEKLHITRQLLLGKLTDFDSFDQGNILEAVIVIEEFCKELAAIAFVKYHASS